MRLGKSSVAFTCPTTGRAHQRIRMMTHNYKPILRMYRLLTVIACLVVFPGVCFAQTEESASADDNGASKRPSPVLERVSRERKAYRENPFLILPNRPNYFMPITYIDDPGEVRAEGEDVELDNVEAKFQISFKLPLWENPFGKNTDLLFAYTQLSLWQMYNGDLSSPFRDTNYEPELVASFDTDYELLGLTNRFFLLGFVHQSNGRGEPLSRSWNRVYANFIMEEGNFVLSIKPWYRIPESEDDDDNPDIEDYLGYGEVRGVYKYSANVFSIEARNNLDGDENRGSLELSWTFPLGDRYIGYAEVFSGYGETLIDYNRDITRIGIGVAMSTWF